MSAPVRLCSFYTTRMLTRADRESFELPAWPFLNGVEGEIPKECLDYFHKLGVIHWGDSGNKNGVPNRRMVVMPDGKMPDELDYSDPMPVWRHHAAIELENFTIIDIPKELRATISDKDWLAHYGDFKYWLEFNHYMEIVAISDRRIKYVNERKLEGRGLQNQSNFREENAPAQPEAP